MGSYAWQTYVVSFCVLDAGPGTGLNLGAITDCSPTTGGTTKLYEVPVAPGLVRGLARGSLWPTGDHEQANKEK